VDPPERRLAARPARDLADQAVHLKPVQRFLRCTEVIERLASLELQGVDEVQRRLEVDGVLMDVC